MDENGRSVQYFQRARFEWHGENPPEYRVQLGLLGDEQIALGKVTVPAEAMKVGPSPILPVPRWRSSTAILARSRSASATASPSRTVGASTSDSVTTWSGTRPTTCAFASSRHGIRNRSAPTGWMRTVFFTHSGTSERTISSTGSPRLRTSSGWKLSRSGRSRMSAW